MITDQSFETRAKPLDKLFTSARSADGVISNYQRNVGDAEKRLAEYEQEVVGERQRNQGLAGLAEKYLQKAKTFIFGSPDQLPLLYQLQDSVQQLDSVSRDLADIVQQSQTARDELKDYSRTTLEGLKELSIEFGNLEKTAGELSLENKQLQQDYQKADTETERVTIKIELETKSDELRTLENQLAVYGRQAQFYKNSYEMNSAFADSLGDIVDASSQLLNVAQLTIDEVSHTQKSLTIGIDLGKKTIALRKAQASVEGAADRIAKIMPKVNTLAVGYDSRGTSGLYNPQTVDEIRRTTTSSRARQAYQNKLMYEAGKEALRNL